MKKVIFIDRDGTLIVEPSIDLQVDSLAKLEFIPRAIGALSHIAELDYELVIATNQDGLGTDSFPWESFDEAHQKMLTTLSGEGVVFDDQLIDRSFEHENAPTRKPRTGMFGKYLSGEYDLTNSFVIGDRLTDVELALNLGAQAILFQDVENSNCVLCTTDWMKIYEFLRYGSRRATIERSTRETQISIILDLDRGMINSSISTGLHFFDHQLEQIIHHAGVGLLIDVKGDLHVDEHHTIEDTAIALGEAFYQALGSKIGIERYGFALPMDECRAMVLLDFGGRIDFQWNTEFHREMVGDMPTEMFEHFFKSFATAARCNLHIEASGLNEHHKIEAIFKAFSRTLRQAIRRTSNELPSSKGVI